MAAAFGVRREAEPIKDQASGVDIVFNTDAETLYIAKHEKHNQTVDRTIELAAEWATCKKFDVQFITL